jgi:hypothetical protein
MFLIRVRKRVYRKLVEIWDNFEKEFFSKSGFVEIGTEKKIGFIRDVLKNRVKLQIRSEKEWRKSKRDENHFIFWTQPDLRYQKVYISIDRLFTKQVFWSMIRQSQKLD